MNEQQEEIQKKYWHMHEVAELTGMNESHIRFYDKELGLNLRRNSKGERFFTANQVELMKELQKLKQFLTIRGMKILIACNRLGDIGWLADLLEPGRPSISDTQEEGPVNG
jgi:DNA-binding transcriptional MerR regulator